MLTKQIYEPLLALRSRAHATGEAALITYYTQTPWHLTSLEREIEMLDRTVADLRLALQAVRSRGENPMKDRFDV